MITCAIIDDEPLAVTLLESYVKRVPELDLKGKYLGAREALAALTKEPVDLVFLDIQMPELKGLELSRQLPAQTYVIFTTAYSQYAIQGYRANAVGYLLKPISFADFKETIDCACRRITGQATPASPAPAKDAPSAAAPAEARPTATKETVAADRSIFVKSDYKIIRVFIDDILYVEGLKDYVKIHLLSTGRSIISLTSMRNIEQLLPADIFMRTHRSYIVNMSKVSLLERSCIVFGDKYLPVSDSYKDRVRQYVADRMLSQ